jgi:hypothetical protein
MVNHGKALAQQKLTIPRPARRAQQIDQGHRNAAFLALGILRRVNDAF